MKKGTIDTVLQVRLLHRPGQLARLAQAVATESGLLGDIRTLRFGEDYTVREVTVETNDDEQTQRVVAAVSAVAGVEVLGIADRVFELHQGGKIHSTSRVALDDIGDLRAIYTPGVARIVRAIELDRERARELTGIGNSVGIFTNGTRVLGLGDVGVVASLPVMEGKAVLYDKFAGISATPVLVDTRDPAEFVATVERLAPTFGGIHLEDIRSPDCFWIEEELDRRLAKPVMHDDQHGTATAALAALITASRLLGTNLRRSRIGQIGLGAAGSAIARLVLAYGVGELLVHDSSADAVRRMSAAGAIAVDMPTLMERADVVIAATGRPGVIPLSSIRPGHVIFALSNPQPEIEPERALAAGARFASDGRSINNALAFPGLFKGALTTRSRAITPSMMVAAAVAISELAEGGDLVPSPLTLRVHQSVARAVALEARSAGLADTSRC